MYAERVVNAVAPIRICDLGGWTDTWFAGHGSVLNIGVYPYVEVQLTAGRRGANDPPVVLDAENYGDRYVVVPGDPMPARHPLLEAAVEEVGVPEDVAVEISIYSDAPGGCSTGTSAAVTVALIGALDRLTPGRMTPLEVARVAHRVEVERLGLQSGVQDQLCSAVGGVSLIEISEYPTASVSRLELPDTTWWELERRLVLLFLGKTHVSSAVHDKVITELSDEGPRSPRLEPLRRMASEGRRALESADFDAFGDIMKANTDAQAALHSDLISADAQRAIDFAREHGAIGWKVNGAGGPGGSLTLLAGDSAPSRRRMLTALEAASPLFQVIPTYLSHFGLRVWEVGAPW